MNNERVVGGHTVSARFHDPLIPGTLVLAWPGSRDGSPMVTRTRGEVWTLGDGTPVVRVEDHAGGIALTHIEVLPVAARPADEDGLRAAIEALAEKWEGWSRNRSTPRIDAFRDAAADLRNALEGQ